MGVERIDTGRFLVRARIRVNGRICQKQATFTGTREAAKAEVERFKAKLRTDGAGCSLISTFSEALSAYEQHRQEFSYKGLSPSYRSRIGALRRDLGAVGIVEFADRFEQYLRLVRNTTTVRGTPPSKTTINRIIEVVRAVFNVAIAKGQIKANPISKARFAKTKEYPRKVTLDTEREQRLFAAIDRKAPYLRPFVEYSLLVPCRKSELTGATRDQLNIVAGTLFIPAEKAKAGVAITKPLPLCMKSYFRNLPPADVCPWVFYRFENGQYHPLGDFKRAWRTVTRAAGQEGLRVHDLRHVAASRLHANGTPEHAINMVAGWQGGSAMLSRYFGETPAKTLEMLRFSIGCANECENTETKNREISLKTAFSGG